MQLFRGQIQSQNVRIKVFDSSLINISMAMSRMFRVVEDNDVMVNGWLVMEFKNKL
jgi:hypothetical protein